LQADEEDSASQFLIPRSETGKNVSYIYCAAAVIVVVCLHEICTNLNAATLFQILKNIYKFHPDITVMVDWA